jgi:hypothetical protein
MNKTLSTKDLDLIIEEFNKPSADDYTTIKNVLKLCPKRIKVQFALDSCNSIRHLIRDKRSTDALDAIQVYLDTGKPVPEEVRAAYAAANAAAYAANDAANAAYAAYAANDAANAAYAANDAAYAAYAAYAAANAAAYAAAAKPGSPEWNRIKVEKMREHLNRLKELILQNAPAKYDNFLLRIAL